MGKIRDEVEIWWNCLTEIQQNNICKKHFHYSNYISLNYYDMEYLWIKSKDDYQIDDKTKEKVIRKLKIKKINNLVI